jgi:hypothetical protein
MIETRSGKGRKRGKIGTDRAAKKRFHRDKAVRY